MSAARLFRAVAGALLAASAVGLAQASDGPVKGDPAAGKTVYDRCLACHALAYDRTGPRHCGLFGRRAGSVKDFAYSEALKRSGIVWNERTLDRFLASPLTAVPGTAMGYSGVTDRKERADLIAWLKRANESQECKSPQ